MSHQNDPVSIAFALLFIGGAMLYRGVKRYRRSIEIEDTPSIPIAAAPQGKVEIQAFAWPSLTPAESITSKHCVYQYLGLERLTQHGKSSSWDTIWSTTHSQPFFCVDTSGFALVDIEGASIDVESLTLKWSELSEKQRDLLLKMIPPIGGFPPGTGFFSGASSYRIVERAILVGSPILVEGEFSSTKPITAKPHIGLKTFQERVQTLKRMQESGEMRLFDKNHDGKVSCEEFRDAFCAAASTAFGKIEDPIKEAPRGVLHKSENYELFVADTNSKYLLERIGRWNIARMIAGAFLIAAGVFVILNHWYGS